MTQVQQPETPVLAVALEPERTEQTGLADRLDGRVAFVVGSPDSPLATALERAGVGSHVVRGADAADALGLALRQLGELRALRTRADDRARTERAKGILMARHGIQEREAFAMLRRHARRTHRKVAEVAAAVLASHPLLAPTTRETEV